MTISRLCLFIVFWNKNTQKFCCKSRAIIVGPLKATYNEIFYFKHISRFWNAMIMNCTKKSRVYSIHHFHIGHNAPCLPPKFCIAIIILSSISLWTTVIPRRNWKQMVVQNLGGGGGLTRCIMVYVKRANSFLFWNKLNQTCPKYR